MLNTTKISLICLITGKCIVLVAPREASGDAVAQRRAILQPPLRPPCPCLQEIWVEGAEDRPVILRAAANPDQEAGKAEPRAAGDRWAPGMGRNWGLRLRSVMLQEPEVLTVCFRMGARSSMALGRPQRP